MSCQQKQMNKIPDYMVCGCMNIWYEHITREIAAGADTIEKLKEKLAVSTGCGSCLEEVKSILAQEKSCCKSS
jgi:assimilatory nitrate reductase catalytic subunit